MTDLINASAATTTTTTDRTGWPATPVGLSL